MMLSNLLIVVVHACAGHLMSLIPSWENTCGVIRNKSPAEAFQHYKQFYDTSHNMQ
jgi:hypothetical protein